MANGSRLGGLRRQIDVLHHEYGDLLFEIMNLGKARKRSVHEAIDDGDMCVFMCEVLPKDF